jgi:hypothetical protein
MLESLSSLIFVALLLHCHHLFKSMSREVFQTRQNTFQRRAELTLGVKSVLQGRHGVSQGSCWIAVSLEFLENSLDSLLEGLDGRLMDALIVKFIKQFDYLRKGSHCNTGEFTQYVVFMQSWVNCLKEYCWDIFYEELEVLADIDYFRVEGNTCEYESYE